MVPKIALVGCPYGKEDFETREDMAFDDLNLGYLYSALTEKGYSVERFDTLHHQTPVILPSEELVRRIVEFCPSYICFSDPIHTFAHSMRTSSSIREKLPDATIIYNDFHASMYNREILENEPHIDYVICGEADRNLPMLIEKLERKEEIDQLLGLTFRANGEIKANPPDLYIDMNTLPFPHRPSLSDPESNRHLFFNLISSRGCPERCTYCPKAAFLSRYCREPSARYRYRSPQNIFEEIYYLYARGVRKFLFHDENWIGEKKSGLKRAVELCRLITDHRLNDITLGAAVRPDSLFASDLDDILILKQAGLSIISFGLEAGNEFQLKTFGKKYDASEAKQTLSLLFDSNIMVRIGFMMFFPYSTFDMLRQNADFLSDCGVSYMLTAYFGKLTALSALPIEDKLTKDNLVARPTTYLASGEYKYRDERMDEFQRFLQAALLPETPFVFEILSFGARVSRHTKKNSSAFPAFREILTRIGDQTDGLFRFCLDVWESEPDDTAAIKQCYPRSLEWRNAIGKEKERLDRFKSRIFES